MKVFKNTTHKTACVIFLIALISLSSCMSTTPMFDNYIKAEYPHFSKFKVNKSKSLKGVNLAFKEYLKDFDRIDTSLIVIVDYRGLIKLMPFITKVHFIKDYKLDKSYQFEHKDYIPKNIDSLVEYGVKYTGTYYFDFIGPFIKENGVENIKRIIDTEYCGFLTGIGSTNITIFNPNLEVVYSHSFPRTLNCVDIEFLRQRREMFLEKN